MTWLAIAGLDEESFLAFVTPCLLVSNKHPGKPRGVYTITGSGQIDRALDKYIYAQSLDTPVCDNQSLTGIFWVSFSRLPFVS